MSQASYGWFQTYGFAHLVTLANLEKAGLLRLYGTRNLYNVYRKNLKLTVDTVDETVGHPFYSIGYLIICDLSKWVNKYKDTSLKYFILR